MRFISQLPEILWYFLYDLTHRITFLKMISIWSSKMVFFLKHGLGLCFAVRAVQAGFSAGWANENSLSENSCQKSQKPKQTTILTVFCDICIKVLLLLSLICSVSVNPVGVSWTWPPRHSCQIILAPSPQKWFNWWSRMKGKVSAQLAHVKNENNEHLWICLSKDSWNSSCLSSDDDCKSCSISLSLLKNAAHLTSCQKHRPSWSSW